MTNLQIAAERLETLALVYESLIKESAPHSTTAPRWLAKLDTKTPDTDLAHIWAVVQACLSPSDNYSGSLEGATLHTIENGGKPVSQAAQLWFQDAEQKLTAACEKSLEDSGLKDVHISATGNSYLISAKTGNGQSVELLATLEGHPETIAKAVDEMLKVLSGSTMQAGTTIVYDDQNQSYSSRFALGHLSNAVSAGVFTNVESTPVPTPTPEQVRMDESKILLPEGEKIYFDTGKSTIKSVSYHWLDEVATVLKSHPEILNLRVEGHTDDVGNDLSNLKLSQARAESVVKYLTSKGVAKDRLDAAGFGEMRPIAPNDSAENRAKNRRIEFIIVEKAD